MIHVALDTTIYREKPRLDSPEFRALVFLAKNKCICLHIPFIVENEFRSHLEIEQKKKVDSAISTLQKICDYPFQGDKTVQLHNAILNLPELAKEIIIERGDAFLKWASDINAVRHELSTEETYEAFNAYFKGESPLKEPKIRNDIPDSFIYQSFLKINSTNPLHVIVKDEKLRDACKKAGLKYYSELSSFIESEEVKTLLQGKIKDSILEAVESQIIDYLRSNKKILLNKIEEKLLSDEYRMISGDHIPGESNEIYVSGVYEPYNIKIDTHVEHYGDALFVVGFSSLVELTYEYAVYRSDAYDLDTKKYYIEYLNDHYFNIETTDVFSFSGRIELEYDIPLESVDSISELLETLSEPSITIEELDDFEIYA